MDFRSIRLSEPVAFDVLRMALAPVLIAKLLAEMPDLLPLYGRSGVLQWQLSEAGLNPWLPRMSWIADVAAREGIGADAVVLLLASVYLACLFLLTVGLASRFSALGAWLCHAVMSGSVQLTEYGADMFATIGLFYCAIAPVGMLSLDHLLLRRSARATRWATILLYVFQFQMCIMYCDTGTVKAVGQQWWNGEAIWLALTLPDLQVQYFGHILDWGWIAHHPWLLEGMSWNVVLVEALYPLAMLSKFRRLWLFLVVMMHLGIALCLGLWFFSGIMIVLNLAAFSSNEALASLRVLGAMGRSAFGHRSLK